MEGGFFLCLETNGAIGEITTDILYFFHNFLTNIDTNVQAN